MPSSTIPIFPLPDVVLFPGVFLPLHVFEPRYREMVSDALAGDRLIGIVLLRPGWEHDYVGEPRVYPIGCLGLITHAEHLDDGGYNVVLHGLNKFRIVAEESDLSYRVAHVETIDETPGASLRGVIRERRDRLEDLLAPLIDAAEQRLPDTMPDDELVNALSQYLDLEPVERQALLEREDVVARCDSLIDLLEMRALLAGGSWTGRGDQ